MHDDDTDDLDFAMLTPTTRPGPCKAATAPEADPVERRLNEEREACRHRVARAIGLEVRHGSGKVKV